MLDTLERKKTDLLLAVTLLRFCQKIIGASYPAQAAMIGYAIDDLEHKAC
jgi:hypothetical protein